MSSGYGLLCSRSGPVTDVGSLLLTRSGGVFKYGGNAVYPNLPEKVVIANIGNGHFERLQQKMSTSRDLPKS